MTKNLCLAEDFGCDRVRKASFTNREVFMSRGLGEKMELLGLARFCQTTNTALFDFMEDHKNKKGLPEIEKALRFLRLFSTKDGNVIKPFVFGKERKLTHVQILYSQEYFGKNLRKFRLAVKGLSELLSAKSKKPKGKEEKAWHCISFFLGLLYKCMRAVHFGVS